MADAASINNSLLISLVEQLPVLWDKTMNYYKNRVATEAAWKRVAMRLYPEFTTWNEATKKSCVKLIMQRWTHIRDNYYRSYRRVQQQNESGTKPTKPYLYSNKLKFLQKIMPPAMKFNIENIKSENPESDSASIEGSDNGLMETRDVPQNVQPSDSTLGDPISNQEPMASNRHLLFFKGILPSLVTLEDNETLDFQMGVLKLLKKIKSRRQSNQTSAFNIKFEDSSSDHSGYSS